MKRKTLLTILVVFITGGFGKTYSQTNYYSSQAESTESSVDASTVTVQRHNAYQTTWVKNRFKDTWFIKFGGGAQLLMGEDDDKGPFKSRVTFAPTFTIGKYFSPIWGLRVQFTGGSLHGFNDGRDGTYRKWNSGGKFYQGKGYANNLNMSVLKDGKMVPVGPGSDFMTWDPSWVRRGFTTDLNAPANKRIGYNGGDNTYRWMGSDQGLLYMQHVRYVAANVNFMFDFLTLIGNYNPKRVFDITPFAGLSYAHVFPHYADEAYDTFGANGGLDFKFRLSNKFNFNIEAAATLYPDDFDGHEGGSRSIDVVTQLTAGITYKIGKSTWEVSEPMNYQKIQDLNTRINDLKQELQDAKKPCPTCPPCPEVIIDETVTTPNKQIVFLPNPVFFRIDKYAIDANEWSKIDECANYLQNNPNANVVVTGYADRQTAYPAYNLRLSERRAKAVATALINKYGVNPLKISVNWEGDQIQPFAVNEWNRVVIFVIE